MHNEGMFTIDVHSPMYRGRGAGVMGLSEFRHSPPPRPRWCPPPMEYGGTKGQKDA